MRRVLFICGRNKRRSPTAVQVFASYSGIEVASAGLNDDSDILVDPPMLAWADVIFVMEKSHRAELSRKYRAHLKGQRIIFLDIPDEFNYMDETLVVRLLKAVVPRHLAINVSANV